VEAVALAVVAEGERYLAAGRPRQNVVAHRRKSTLSGARSATGSPRRPSS
jgi:hypothetical protein